MSTIVLSILQIQLLILHSFIMLPVEHLLMLWITQFDTTYFFFIFDPGISLDDAVTPPS